MLPLGLGSKPPKFPFLTIALIFINIYCYTQQSVDQKKIKNYQIEAKVGKKENLINYYKEKNLLSKENMTFKSLTQAQFTHVNLTQLFVNMLVLYLIGSFVEAKIGFLLYLFIYLLGGYLGCLLEASSENSSLLYYSLGSSANIFSIIGVFFILFFRYYIKYLWLSLTPPFVKIVLLPACLSLVFFIPALEIFYYLNTLILETNTSIGYLAHLGGFTAGSILAFIYKKKFGLKNPFFYSEEEKIFKQMQKEKKLIQINTLATTLRRYNPLNYVVNFFVLEKSIEKFNQDGFLNDTTKQSFKENLKPILDRHLWKKDYKKAHCLLQEIPFNINISQYLVGLSQKKILHLGNYILAQKDYINAFRTYHLFFSLYKGKKIEKKLLKTCNEIFVKRIDNPKDIENIKTLLELDKENLMSSHYTRDNNEAKREK